MKQTIIGVLVLVFWSCSDYRASNQEQIKPIKQTTTAGMETITLGAGCFWCVEAIFGSINGVESATSGYSGGHVKNPGYKEVCSGTTGHAEVVQVVYDPQVVSLAKILEVFFQVHDPTTLNRQGGDIGTQYRSAIFYHTEEQKATAIAILNKLDMSGAFDKKIVTEITAFTNFYPAEDYHQDYFELNGEQPYCSNVVRPKVEKFKKAFSDILK
ncbi:MAG: peptide-methionine (S)-S-oxide reductase MsrA [Flavobacteriales bacterium]|nr:peptide-methionine (S)-S-oxide reductase MsrA [Flavobacteriales bacterium]